MCVSYVTQSALSTEGSTVNKMKSCSNKTYHSGGQTHMSILKKNQEGGENQERAGVEKTMVRGWSGKDTLR